METQAVSNKRVLAMGKNVPAASAIGVVEPANEALARP